MANRLTIPGSRLALCLTFVAALVVGCATPEQEGEVAKQPLAGARPATTETLMASLYDAAAAAERSGDYTSAVTFYNSINDSDPKNLKATIGLARNLRYVGATGRAIEILEGALVDNPDEPTLVSELGKVQLAAGLPEPALATLMRARDLAPRNWRIHSALGITFDRLGKYDSARLSYQAALDLSPNNVSVLNNLALSHVQTEDLDTGIDFLSRAAALPTATVQVRQNLALLHALKGNIDEAEKLARRDLPEDMVQKNLEYYRLLAVSRSEADRDRPLRPVSDRVGSGTGTVPVRIGPWEEDTEAERAAAAAKGAD